MIDLTTFSVTLSTINMASTFIKNGLNKIKDTAVREKVEELLNAIIPLQSHIIALQSINSTCTKEKEDLEKKLREVENWVSESSKYELNEFAPGVFAYKYKSVTNFPGPLHYLCANCFNTKHQISIIQRRKHLPDGIHYLCNNCSSNFIDHSKPLVLKDDYPENNGIPIT